MTPSSHSVTLPREVVDQALRALREATVSAIAHYNDEPYPDDPRWTPWTRFGRRVAERCENAKDAIEAELAE